MYPPLLDDLVVLEHHVERQADLVSQFRRFNAKKGRCSLDDLHEAVLLFTKGCEHLLSALACRTQFSDTERELISYYSQEIATQAQSLLDKLEQP